MTKRGNLIGIYYRTVFSSVDLCIQSTLKGTFCAPDTILSILHTWAHAHSCTQIITHCIPVGYTEAKLWCACVHAQSLQLCLTLCNPMDCSLPGSSVHGIFQARYWIGLPFPSPGELLNPVIDQTSVSCIAGGFLTVWATRETHYRSIHCFRQAFWDLPIGLCVNLSKNLWLAYGRIRKKIQIL